MNTIKILLKPFTFLFIIAALTLSCGDDGDPGPAGDKGDQGEQGVQGEKGDEGDQGPSGEDGSDGVNGEDGEDGNANVITSDWIEAIYTGDVVRKSFEISDTEITQKILDSGVILFYGKSGEEVWSIPVFFPFLNQAFSFVSSSGGKIIIFCDSSDGFDIVGRPYLDSFRYVIIPSNNAGRLEAIDYSKMSYKEVMDHFDLEY